MKFTPTWKALLASVSYAAATVASPAAITVVTQTAVDTAGPVQNDPAQAAFVLQSGSLLAGKDVTLDTSIQGDHNTRSIVPASAVQVVGSSTGLGNPSEFNFFWRGKVGALTNGAALVGTTDESGSPTGSGNMFAPSSPGETDYWVTFDLGGDFNLNQITTYARHEQGRQDQEYSVFTKSGNGPFTQVGSGFLVDYAADTSLTNYFSGYATTKADVTFTGSDVLSNVNALQFRISNPGTQGFDMSYLSELPAFGSPVPEPTSLGFAALGGVGLAASSLPGLSRARAGGTWGYVFGHQSRLVFKGFDTGRGGWPASFRASCPR